MAPPNDPTLVVLGPGRLSFPALFEAAPQMGDATKLKFEATILLPPDTDIAPLHAALKKAVLDKFGELIPLAPDKYPIKDCEAKTAAKPLKGYLSGWHCITTKSDYAPELFDQRVKPLIDQEALYAGCWVNLFCKAYGYNVKGNRGVTFGLNAVQLVRDGDRLDGRVSGVKAFAPVAMDDTDGAIAAAAQAAQAASGQAAQPHPGAPRSHDHVDYSPPTPESIAW